ncbi:sugar transferase [Endozoicomonas sp. 8E]|uniref:sugar transferase n=1 Tax=Endozoicomonas sp. 8E TaxID=3035692 RepID=UPI0029395169|nr:sugar transferase [Endozoicomonas sp. 8E]WOG26354.1 sugar transferase [Endozoicomonas sp. 8E]
MYRFLDCLLALLGLILSSPLLLVIYIMGLFDTGSPLFSQERVGRYKKPFVLVKFRTMQVETFSVASHLVPSSSITPLGHFLRKTKLDELPQLWNVLVGDMSLVGPRPNLFNQTKLIEAREQLGVYNVLPGLTGLAQVRQIDMSTPELLARTDSQMIRSLTLRDYFKYILMTATGKGQGDRVR